MIFRCGNGASGGKGLVKEGSERAEFRCVDTIRINKLDANDSGFHDFTHDIGQKNPTVLARPAGIEPATLGFGGQYSIH